MNVKYWRLQSAFFKKERIKSQLLKEDRKYILQAEYTWFRKRFFFLLTSVLVNFFYISLHTTGTIFHRIYKYISSYIGKNFPYRKLFYLYLSWFLRILYSFAITWFWQKDFISYSFMAYKIYVLLDIIIIIIIIRHELGFDRPVSPRLIICYWYVPTLHARYTERSHLSPP